MSRAVRRHLLLVTAGIALVAAPAAQAAGFSSTITAPADGTLLFQNEDTSPNQTFTVNGTTTATPGTLVDIDCYNGASEMGIYGGPGNAGIAVGAGGNLSTTVPESSFAGRSCELRAVPHFTTPSPPTGYSGPQVGFSMFGTNELSSGANSGDVYDYRFADQTPSGGDADNSVGSCGPYQTLYDSSQSLAASPTLLNCGGSFFDYKNAFYATVVPDLTRSEMLVDGANAYNAADANGLFTGSNTNPGFPAMHVSLDSFDPTTGDAQTTDTETLVKCGPNDVYSPSASDCTAFAATGVTLTRVTKFTGDGRVATVTDIYASTDGRAHTLDLEYETDLTNSIGGPGWELPGESTFSAHTTGQSAGAPASAPGTIYAISNHTAAPSLANPVTAMSFLSPYNGITFDNTLWSTYLGTGADSALVDYQRTVPAGGSTTIAWSYATGATLAEAQADAAASPDLLAPPAIAITSPVKAAIVAATPATVSGTASAGSGVKAVTVNGIPATISGGGWTAKLPLTRGTNDITAALTSTAGGTASASEMVTFAPPVAATGAARSVGATAATLTGTVTAGGAAVTDSFQIGTSNAYGRTVAAPSLSAGTRAVAVSVTIHGLRPHTTYHYRLVSSGAGGAGNGADRTFTTQLQSPQVRLSAAPHHDSSAPYHYRISGTLKLPAHVSKSAGCRGTVLVRVTHGRTVLASRRATVTHRCGFALAVTLSASRLHGAGTLKIAARFLGNRALAPAAAAAAHTTFG